VSEVSVQVKIQLNIIKGENMWQAILLALAAGAKIHGTGKQQEKYADVKRGRNRVYADSVAKRKKLTDEALASAKNTRSKYAKSEVDSAVANNTEELTKNFSQLPNSEMLSPSPISHNEPSVITTASNKANSKALGDIQRYAGDTAGMTALTSAFSSPDQNSTAMMNRADIMDKARKQRELAQILGLRMDEFDTYSADAELSSGLGDILMMAGMNA
jgi:hypothetical protein